MTDDHGGRPLPLPPESDHEPNHPNGQTSQPTPTSHDALLESSHQFSMAVLNTFTSTNKKKPQVQTLVIRKLSQHYHLWQTVWAEKTIVDFYLEVILKFTVFDKMVWVRML